MSLADAGVKAAVLIEALPYIRKWHAKTVVVKAGGEVLDHPDILDAFATDIALLRFVGMNPVVVHGGGSQISEMMMSMNRQPRFVGGHRVTDRETLEIVKMVMLGQLNRKIVTAIAAHGGRAAGISGEDGNLIQASRIAGDHGEDLGYVGEVEQVNTGILDSLIQGEFIPVVSPLGAGPDGTYNINADLAAGRLAEHLQAEKIVFLTNVKGLFRDLGDESSLMSRAYVDQLEEMLAGGWLSQGMIPKITSAARAVEKGVHTAHILDGRVPHSILLEIFTDEGSGTMVLP